MNSLSDSDKKQRDAEMLGEVLYKHFNHGQESDGGVQVPKVSPSGMSFAYPPGLNQNERDHYDAYIKKMQNDSQNGEAERLPPEKIYHAPNDPATSADPKRVSDEEYQEALRKKQHPSPAEGIDALKFGR